MESTELLETTLAQGRCLELHRVDESNTETLKGRIDNALPESYNTVNFHVGTQDRVSSYTARA